MRIFSNFDTRLKKRTFVRYKEQYGSENVILLGKSKLFLFVKFFLPLMLFLMMSFLFLFVVWYFLGNWLFSYIGLPIISLGLFFVAFPLIRNYIEYSMDFSIVTPKILIMYDQQGIFKRYIKTINAENIKTISVERDGLFYSIFNNGDLMFLSEGADLDHGEVILHYIYKPERKRHSIGKILDRV